MGNSARKGLAKWCSVCYYPRMNRPAVVLTFGALVIVAIAIIVWSQSLSGARAPASDSMATSADAVPGNLEQYVGQITTDVNGTSTYTSPKYGLSFTYPKGWRVGDNHLGYGTFQLFNYDESEVDGKSVFKNGQNKIEAGVSTGSPEESAAQIKIDPHADYIISSVTHTRVKIAGQDSIRTDVVLMGGQQFHTYRIPLKTTSGVFLGISMYGDALNFSILDQIVRSIMWI